MPYQDERNAVASPGVYFLGIAHISWTSVLEQNEEIFQKEQKGSDTGFSATPEFRLRYLQYGQVHQKFAQSPEGIQKGEGKTPRGHSEWGHGC